MSAVEQFKAGKTDWQRLLLSDLSRQIHTNTYHDTVGRDTSTYSLLLTSAGWVAPGIMETVVIELLSNYECHQETGCAVTWQREWARWREWLTHS